MAPTAPAFGQIVPPNESWLARAEPEKALDPDLPIVDAHLHFWHMPDSAPYFADDYAADVEKSGHRVDATVFVECRTMYRTTGPEHLRSVGETEFAVGMAAIGASNRYLRTNAASAIVGQVDLTQGARAVEALEAHIESANGRFRGVRHRAKWDPDPVVRGRESALMQGVLRTPEFSEGLDALTRLGLSFDASVFHPQIPDVTALARAHPDARIILNHSGSPIGHASYRGKQKEVHETWLAGMKELAACENVHVKLGGVLLHLANLDYLQAPAPPSSKELAELWRPYIEPCIELFGPARCMVESNFPVDKAGFSYGTVMNMFKRILAPYSRAEKTSVLSGTARRVYRIESHCE